MASNDQNTRVNRRNVLKGTTGLGVLGLAGCLTGSDGDDGGDGGDGDGDGDGGDGGSFEITAGCSSSGSTSFQLCQAMQSIADSHSDTLTYTATAPGGDPASIRQLSQEQVDAATAGTFIMNAAKNEEEPFGEDPVDQLGHMSLTVLTIHMYWLAVEGSGVESLDQAIEEERNIWGFPPEWGLRRLLRANLQAAGRWGEVEPLLVGISAEDVAGAVEEDRVEVFTGYGSNFVNIAGWEVEVDSRAELNLIDVGDWYWEGVQQSPAGFNEDIEVYGWDQDLGRDTTNAWNDTWHIYLHPDVPDDSGYELMDLAYNNWEDAKEVQPAFPELEEPSDLTSGYWDHPVHAGAADWLRDNDAWSDEYIDGGEQ